MEWSGDSWHITICEDGQATVYAIQSRPSSNGKTAYVPFEHLAMTKYDCDKSTDIVVAAELFDATQNSIAIHQAIYDPHDATWASKFISQAKSEETEGRKNLGWH